MSRKVHSEHILATKVLMPMGGGGVFRKMHYSGNVPGNEHIIALPARGMQSIFELLSCLLIGCERAGKQSRFELPSFFILINRSVLFCF